MPILRSQPLLHRSVKVCVCGGGELLDGTRVPGEAGEPSLTAELRPCTGFAICPSSAFPRVSLLCGFPPFSGRAGAGPSWVLPASSTASARLHHHSTLSRGRCWRVTCPVRTPVDSPLPDHMDTLGKGYCAGRHNHGYPPCREKESVRKGRGVLEEECRRAHAADVTEMTRVRLHLVHLPCPIRNPVSMLVSSSVFQCLLGWWLASTLTLS